ncbi:hypothetical protein [Cohnella caldifontis]|uniref:hypothetical protein n=1 Tax=Cohnella caldifontis TaxID=3027471 RepID=UPI0023EC9B37|nr:hypothetical protein [Cohnella sp. YIM B05605]
MERFAPFPLRAWIAIAACLVLAAFHTLHPILPRGEAYSDGLAPPWASSAAAVLGLFSVLPSSGWTKLRLIPRQVLAAAGLAAGLLMAWSSAGIGCDVLRFAALAGFDGYPPRVDWMGFAQRAISLLGAVMLFVNHARFRREPFV